MTAIGEQIKNTAPKMVSHRRNSVSLSVLLYQWYQDGGGCWHRSVWLDL